MRRQSLMQRAPMKVFLSLERENLLDAETDADDATLADDVRWDIRRLPSGGKLTVVSECSTVECTVLDGSGNPIFGKYPCDGRVTWEEAFGVNPKSDLFQTSQDVIRRMANTLIDNGLSNQSKESL